jgi:hypothetical protein
VTESVWIGLLKAKVVYNLSGDPGKGQQTFLIFDKLEEKKWTNTNA